MARQSARRVTAETKVIGANIMRLRRAFGFSQEQVAKALGITFQQVQKYEKGESRVSAERLFLLKNFLGVPYAEFFSGMNPDNRTHAVIAKQAARRIRTLSDTAPNRKILRLILLLLSEA